MSHLLYKVLFFTGGIWPDIGLIWFGLWCLTPLSIIFQLYHGSQFIGGGNRSTRWKPLTCHKLLTKLITWWCCIKYTSPWTGFKLTTLVAIGTDGIGSYKSNYYMITTTMAPIVSKIDSSVNMLNWFCYLV
jgi:hypothetical protein